MGRGKNLAAEKTALRTENKGLRSPTRSVLWLYIICEVESGEARGRERINGLMPRTRKFELDYEGKVESNDTV